MEEVVTEALISGIALPLLAALVLTGVLRFMFGAGRGPSVTAAAIGIAFLAGYAMTLGWPDFPPQSASQKLVYIALADLVLGLAVDFRGSVDNFRLIMILAWPALIIGWLGWRQLLNYSGDIGVTLAFSWVAGAFIIIRLTGEPEVKSTPAIMLLFAAIGVSIVALLGASASIAQLAGTLAAAIGGFLLWNWPWARYPLGAAGVLLSLVLTLGLFSEDVSRPALGLLILIFLAPPLAARLPLGRHAVLGPVVLGIVAAIPVAIAALIAFAAGGGEF